MTRTGSATSRRLVPHRRFCAAAAGFFADCAAGGRRRDPGVVRPIGIRQDHDAEHARRAAGADRGQITLDGQILFRRDPEAKLVNVPLAGGAWAMSSRTTPSSRI